MVLVSFNFNYVHVPVDSSSPGLFFVLYLLSRKIDFECFIHDNFA